MLAFYAYFARRLKAKCAWLSGWVLLIVGLCSPDRHEFTGALRVGRVDSSGARRGQSKKIAEGDEAGSAGRCSWTWWSLVSPEELCHLEILCFLAGLPKPGAGRPGAACLRGVNAIF